MTRYEAILRQLSDNEKHHERAQAKHEVAVEMIAFRDDISLCEARALIASEYELRQSRKVGVGA